VKIERLSRRIDHYRRRRQPRRRRGLGPAVQDRAGEEQALTRDEYVRIREQYARGQEVKARASLPAARQNRFQPDPATPLPCAPSFLGVRAFDSWDLGDLADHIDWTPFFASWELIGRYPLILEDEIVGEAARDLFKDARRC
jgi:5-methyltetrahydrofolate--homocysteine methyltransferase